MPYEIQFNFYYLFYIKQISVLFRLGRDPTALDISQVQRVSSSLTLSSSGADQSTAWTVPKLFRTIDGDKLDTVG